MTVDPAHIATAALLDDPYAALSQHLHGDGDAPPLRITYRNWRGEVSERNIVPQSVWFGATEWHPEPQWLLSALDTDKGAARDFALADFGANDDTWRTRALAAEVEVERLRAAANDLNGIVEGIDGTMIYGTWRAETTGSRLKDTKEWVKFYTALAALNQHLRGDGDAAWRTRALAAEAGVERLRNENELLRYVLDGVAAAIDTGRNEPLHIWRGQIDIARAALAEGGPDDR